MNPFRLDIPRSTARTLAGAVVVWSAVACAGSGTPASASASPAGAADQSLLPGPMPARPPQQWVGLLGEYDAPAGMRLVLEDSGKLWIADTSHNASALRETSVGSSEFVVNPEDAGRILGRAAPVIKFARDAGGRSTSATVGDTRIVRRDIEPGPGTNQLRVTPVRPVAELRVEALAASPPKEQGTFHAPELVELTHLDPTIKLEIRYATTNNFLGTRFYDEARAFMQAPAAQAVVRAHQSLRALGYGLLIHDAYRPWYVTRMFWDATPVEKRWLVANPAEGSRHNRGSAVDLTLYEISSGRPIDMPSTYDESTDRAFARYPGGTSLQRWHRALLRRAMEAQGFAVNPNEWWHFDFNRWREYSIGNVAFDKIAP
ncbi:MAG: M15 family metallopeptidase [bacterium]